MTEEYDAIVIGAGPGGYSTALRIAQLGGRAAVVEKYRPGGVCATKGCIPTKALLKMLRSREKGTADIKKLNNAKNLAVKRSVRGVEFLLQHRKVDLFQGIAKIREPGVVRAVSEKGATELRAPNIVIATGTHPADIPPARVDRRFVLSSDDILDHVEKLDSLVIVGGGVIGVEFASIFNRMGTEVTIIESQPHLVPSEDPEACALLEKLFQRDGINVFTGATVEQAAEGVVRFTDGEGSQTEIAPDKVLVAVGRRTNLDMEEMERLGVELDRQFIKVDEHMRTSVHGIYAVGDITGKSMLAHAAHFQGRAAAETIMGRVSRADHRLIPNCIYSIPELGSVGMDNIHEREDLECVKVPFRLIASAQMEGSAEGFIKLWHDGWKMHAVTVIGPGAPEIISLAALALQYGGDLQVLKNAIIPHPSLSEIFSEAIHAALGEGLHVPD